MYVNESDLSDVDNVVIDFISNLSTKNNQPLKVVFYGGEPLLYFAKIEYIVSALRDCNIRFSIISNGTKLNAKMVDFINRNNIVLTVSYEGSVSAITRGVDVFATTKLKSHLLSVEKLGLRGVITAKGTLSQIIDDYQNIFDQYFAIHSRWPQIALTELYDINLNDRSLFFSDYASFADEVAVLFKKFLKQYKSYGNNSALGQIFGNYIETLKLYVYDYYSSSLITKWGACRTGRQCVKVDCKGNLYACFNNQTSIIGGIGGDFSNYDDGLRRYDLTEKSYEQYCNKCTCYALCRGGCALILPEHKELAVCKFNRALYGTILKQLSETFGIAEHIFTSDSWSDSDEYHSALEQIVYRLNCM